MTFKPGDKHKTNSGDDYTVLAVLSEPDVYGHSIVAVVTGESGNRLKLYDPKGQNAIYGGQLPDRDDLIPSQQKIKGWMVIWRNGASEWIEGEMKPKDGFGLRCPADVVAMKYMEIEYAGGDGL